MNCPKCHHETHESKIMGCHKCEVCGWHGNPEQPAPIGNNTVTMTLADYQLGKTALGESAEFMEAFISKSVDGAFCNGCDSKSNCNTCGIRSMEHSAKNVVAKIKVVMEG